MDKDTIHNKENAIRPEVASRPLLKDQAYEELKELILSGVYSPGTFLSERQLTARFGMSKTPVRSAIERLEMEGFLIVSPQQGVVVAELSLDEIVDHFEIRLALETFVARRLAGKLDAHQIKTLKRNLEAQVRAAEQGDVVGYRKLDTEFHLILCESLGNKEILQVMRRLADKLSRVIFRIISQHPARMSSSSEEHRDIFEAIIEGDGETTAKRMERHLEWGRKFLASR